MLGEEQALHNRYHIQRQLGHNAGRHTLLAQDLHTQELVVLKILSFNSDFRWEDLKLFEREAETLKSLSYPAIPRYLDYFEELKIWARQVANYGANYRDISYHIGQSQSADSKTRFYGRLTTPELDWLAQELSHWLGLPITRE